MRCKREVLPASKTPGIRPSSLPFSRPGEGFKPASILIAMPRPEAFADAMGDLQEFRRFADVECAVARQIAVDHIGDTPGRGDMTTIRVER